MKTIDDEMQRLPGYLSAREFGEATGRSRHAAYRWINEGKIEAFQIAGTIVISETELSKILEAK
jgi:hypothetical protein